MKKKRRKQPMQPVVLTEDEVAKFQENAIVRYLLDAGPFGMDDLEVIPFPQEDREQFAQLIGYSLGLFGGLDYVRHKTYKKAAKRMRKLKGGK